MGEELSAIRIVAGFGGFVVLCTLTWSLDTRAARPYAIPMLILATFFSSFWLAKAPSCGPPLPDIFAAALVFLGFFCFASAVMLLVLVPLSIMLHYVGSR